jgi:mono/diheme cytochrome c family protein
MRFDFPAHNFPSHPCESAYNAWQRKSGPFRDAFFLTPLIGEVVMAKLVLLLVAGTLVAVVPARVQGVQSRSSSAHAHASHTAASTQTPAKPPADPLARAKDIYKIDCAVCHGDNGNGKTDLATSMTLTLGDWTDPKTLADKSDADLFKIIRDGKDKMPPEAPDRAKDDDVRSLVTYIRSFSKSQTATTTAAAATAPK